MLDETKNQPGSADASVPAGTKRDTRRPPLSGLPPLESGDRLKLAEFMRRYEAMPDVKKAELIEGVVYMPSPVRVEHSSPHGDLIWFLVSYKIATPGVQSSDNTTALLDDDNGPQPDASLRILPECGGQSRTENGYVAGAPELMAEISASTVSRDLHDKFTAYERSGVLEYLVWRVWDAALDWFVLRDGRFARVEPDEQGVIRSSSFPGLWLNVLAMLEGDLPRVLETLQLGLATPEHAAFVERLRNPPPPAQ
jgi:Uma2 family endonuclease